MKYLLHTERLKLYIESSESLSSTIIIHKSFHIFYVCSRAHRGLTVGFLLLQYSFVYTVEPYLSFISFLCLDLYLKGDDTSIS